MNKEYINLGLPSGTLWANENYTDGEVQYFTYDEATDLPVDLPTIDQFKELVNECEWTWDKDRKGSVVTGKNGNQIFLPAKGYARILYPHDMVIKEVGCCGYYWASTLLENFPDHAMHICFGNYTYGNGINAGAFQVDDERISVRPVRNTRSNTRTRYNAEFALREGNLEFLRAFY